MERHIYSAIMNRYFAKFVGVLVDFAGDKFWNIKRLHGAMIVIGVFLRQQERFGRFPAGIHVGDIGTGVKTVYPPAAEYNPPTVAAP